MVVSHANTMSSSSSHRLLVQNSTTQRLEALARWLEERLDAGSGEILLLAPSRGAADDLLRRQCPPRGLFGVHRFTLRQLAAELATPAMAAAGLAPVSRLGSEALAARCLARCRDAGGSDSEKGPDSKTGSDSKKHSGSAKGLDYFLPVAEAPGLPRALRRTLDDLRFGEVEPADLASTGAPGKDLARLLTLYEDEMERWQLADDASVLQLASQRAEQGGHALSGLPMVWLDLSPRHRLEEHFLSALAASSPAIMASLPEGDRRGQQALETVLGTKAESPTAESTVETPNDAAPRRKLDRLRQRIFRPNIETLDPPAADDDSVVLRTAPGEGRECVEMARRIRQLASDGVPFDQMAILLRDPHGYLPLVEDALRRADIPGYFTRGTTRPHPAGRAFLALLACVSEKLSAARFAEYLSLGQVPTFDLDEGDRTGDDDGASRPAIEVPWVLQDGDQLVFKSLLPLDATTDPDGEEGAEDDLLDDEDTPVLAGTLRTPRRWERLLVEAAVLGGAERWRRRLRGLAAELKLQLEGLDPDDDSRRQRLRRQMEQLRHLEEFALPIIERLDALPSSATWGEWLKELEELAQVTLRQPEQVLSLLAELRPMDQVGPVGLEEVRYVLSERLTLLSAEPPARRYARVFVATIEEARGRSFEAVFLPGLAEGIFPRRASEDPLLLDVYRQALGNHLTVQRDRIDDERLLLRIAAGAARRQLLVSYPNLDALEGRSRVPSFYALDLLRAAEGTLPDFRQLAQRASAGAASILGWPAPRDAEQAIDDAEYDLAVIEPLLRLPGPQAKARGRYLLESNRHLTRSLRRRYRRWHPRWSSADGLAQSDAETLDALKPHGLRQRSYSPTALQHFAACPYRFALAAIFSLRPRDTVSPIEQLDPLTRGSLFHQVQFELFSTLQEHQLLPMRQDDLPQLLELADRTLDGVAQHYEEELAPAIPRVWKSQVESLRSDVRGWIRSVTAADEPWRPAHFEMAFGLPSRDARHEAVVLDGKRLRGSIDLVEVDDDRGVLRITDHKTGSAPKKGQLVIGGGEVLQPLLYALAAEVHLDKPVDSGRLFFCTRKGRFETREVPLNAQNRQYVSLVLDVIDRSISEGQLLAVPREGACKHCDYRTVCGPMEELRTRRKKPGEDPRLRALYTVRQSP